MVDTVSFKRLILRAVLRHVSPMVIRLISVSDHMPLPEFHDVFRATLGWKASRTKRGILYSNVCFQPFGNRLDSPIQREWAAAILLLGSCFQEDRAASEP
jgi:hypothetical protein